jgi:flavin reductase
MVERDDFRAAMARLAATVSIVATDGPGGRHGITASAVCSVSDEPATVLACINRASRINTQLKQNGVMSVNVLAHAHREMSLDFAGRPGGPEDRFAAGAWGQLATGAPILLDASIALDCRIVSMAEVGTHSVFFGQLLALRMSEAGNPLLYYNRDFHTIAAGIETSDGG